MSLEVTGKLLEVSPVQQIKENFSKREFVIEITDESPNGMVFTNFASFQLVNNNTAVIEQFQPGEMLKVSFNIRGNRWEKDGIVKYITNLNAWRVERAATGTQQAAPQNQGYPQQDHYQGPSNQQQGGFPTNPNSDEGTDLPF